jgi:uncharacterized repeat protein (TIGR01451 family)
MGAALKKLVRTRVAWLALAAAAVVGLCLPAGALADFPAYPVSSSADSGGGTLREAIIQSNLTPPPNGEANVISPTGGGPLTVHLTSSLPPITVPVLIDGDEGGMTVDASQAGAQGVGLTLGPGSLGSQIYRVTITGAQHAGILLEDRDIEVGTVHPDVISGNPGDGILVSGAGATGEQIDNNFIGTDSGGAPAPNDGAGVAFTGGASGSSIVGDVINEGTSSPAVDLGGAANTVSQVTLSGGGSSLITGGRSIDVGASGANFQVQGAPSHDNVTVDLYSTSCAGGHATVTDANGSGTAATDGTGAGTGMIIVSGTFPAAPLYLASDSAGTDSLPNPCTDVALAASGPSSGRAGTAASYVFTITNDGPGPAAGVVFSDPVPAGSAGASASSPAGPCAVAATITCELGALAPGSSTTVTVTLTPIAAGSLTEAGNVTLGDVNEVDENPGNNSASATTAIAPGTMPIPDVPAQVTVGQASASGTNAQMPVICSGSTGPTCPVTATMTLDQTPVAPSLKGTFDPATAQWTLQTGSGTTSFTFGNPGDVPMTGDWAGSGRTGIGVFRPSNGLIYLRNQASAGFADYAIVLGIPGDVPVTGDWTGSGRTGIGVFRPTSGTWFLKNDARVNGAAFADTAFTFGVPGWIPVTGDWSGRGVTGIGGVDPNTGTWYLRNEAGPDAPAPDEGPVPDEGVFQYGLPGWRPVTGDWVGSGATGIGAVDPSTGTWYLRSEAGQGGPDAGTVRFGAAQTDPVSGTWNLPAGTIAHARRSRKPKKLKPIVIGTSKVTIRAGTSRTIKVGLNAEGRKLLAQHHTLKAILVIKVGSVQIAQRTITFKVKHHR